MLDDEKEQTTFIEEQRSWLKQYRAETGLSWKEMGKRTNVAESTLAAFGGERGYAGRELPIADAVLRFREKLAKAASVYVDAPEIPGFFDTQGSTELINLLLWAQRGKMVYAALNSGLGKSMAARRFAELYPNVKYIVFPPSSGSQGPMQQRVLAALGVKNAKGTPSSLSALICERIAAMHQPVLIFDEAQHLTGPALEEIRSWHDDTGAGVALLGDHRLAQLIENGTGKNDLPQLRSRLRKMPARMLPYRQDVDATARAWNITDARVIAELGRIAQKPGTLRLLTQVLEGAAMLAAAAGEVLDLGHVQQAASDAARQERQS